MWCRWWSRKGGSVEEQETAGAEFVADVVADGEAETFEFAHVHFEGLRVAVELGGRDWRRRPEVGPG